LELSKVSEKPRHRCRRDEGNIDVSGDGRLRHVGDPSLGEDDGVAGRAEETGAGPRHSVVLVVAVVVVVAGCVV
jgi:hypothetical protein